MKVETQKTITNVVDNGELSLQDLEWVSGGQNGEDYEEQSERQEEEESGPQERN
ncbi:hypothetical protein NIES2100_62900 [Calothrix sp. NIES-2100]|uniref:hypothetical protein n=1 Tax=Calothrix sp. NIES-2100 TaxID=1954172 RepID=UPI000B5F1E8B|nr:hypothetical protein NIES2100_62900 [Calothrix sp. NIES-2100]